MAYPATMSTYPSLSQELWKQTPPAVRTYIEAVDARQVAIARGAVARRMRRAHAVSKACDRGSNAEATAAPRLGVPNYRVWRRPAM